MVHSRGLSWLGHALALLATVHHGVEAQSLEQAHITDSVFLDEPSCNDLSHLAPDQDRCAFVRAHCSADGLIDYLRIYYCYVKPWGVVCGSMMLVACIALLVVLFRIIGRTADEYFTAILSQISQDMGLPPRLGGVTLLALGNGAPDLSSTIAAVRSGDYKMALGSLTGASMFVGCVVAGRIIVLSGGVRARGAQIRDVLSQLVAVLVVTITVASGRFTYATVGTLIGIYAVYVVIVAVADFTKRAGVEWGDVGRDLTKKLSQKFTNGGGLVAPLLQRGSLGQQAQQQEGDQLSDISSVTDEESDRYDPSGLHRSSTGSKGSHVEMSPFDVSPPASNNGGSDTVGGGGFNGSSIFIARSHTDPPQAAGVHSVSFSPTPAEVLGVRRVTTVSIIPDLELDSQRSGEAEPAHHLTTREYRQRALADMAASKSFYKRGARLEVRGEDDEEQEGLRSGEVERGEYRPPPVTLPSHNPEQQQQQQQQINGHSIPEQQQYYSYPVQPHQQQPRLEALGDVIEEEEEDIEELTGLRRTLITSISSWIDIVASPVMAILRCTIPIVEDGAYKRQWFIVSCGVAPLYVCFYLGALHWRALLIALTLGGAGALGAFQGTLHLGDTPPIWSLGTSFPIGAAVVALYGFAVAAMWIDIFASEIVGLLHFMGLLASIDPAVLGVTVLAWGNSLMDYVGNTSMALKSSGGTSMAMTACYAGPLFNMLVGLGVGFWTLLVDSSKSWAKVSFDPIVIVGCVCIMMNCAGIATVAVRHHHHLAKKWGWVMMGWYAMYMAIMLVVVLTGAGK